MTITTVGTRRQERIPAEHQVGVHLGGGRFTTVDSLLLMGRPSGVDREAFAMSLRSEIAERIALNPEEMISHNRTGGRGPDETYLYMDRALEARYDVLVALSDRVAALAALTVGLSPSAAQHALDLLHEAGFEVTRP